MRKLLPLSFVIAGCSSGPSSTDASRAMIAMVEASSSVQSAALSAAQTESLIAPFSATLDYTGACASGGTASIMGSFSGDAANNATFQDTLTFTSCAVGTDSVSGDMSWSSTTSPTGFSWSMTGNIDYSGAAGSFSCDIDVTASLTTTGTAVSESFSGTFCGYDVQQDLHFSPGA